MTRWLIVLSLCLLSACTSSIVDVTIDAKGQDSRVQYVVVHYTSADWERSLKVLTQGPVSSHYLIGDQPKPLVYQLVDENRRAWHAGESRWQGRTWLNSSTIGIELVHPGYRDRNGERQWYPYSQAQIDRLIALLLDIKARHQLPIDAVIGHSDIAPMRKVDPGPLFPWQQLAQAGLIYWPDSAALAAAHKELGNRLPEIVWFQEKLLKAGYGIEITGVWDALSKACLRAFQMKYRPRQFSGDPDLETAALLLALEHRRGEG